MAGGGFSSAPAITATAQQIFDPTLLPYTIDGLSAVRANAGPMYANFLGHSGNMGQGTGTADSQGGLTVGAFRTSLPAMFAAALKARGIPARRGGFYGTALAYGTSTTLADAKAYNPLITTTGSINCGTNGCIGGEFFKFTAAADTVTFSPADAFDRIVVSVGNAAAGSPLTVDTGGAALATISTGSGLVVTNVSAASNIVQPVNIKMPSLSNGAAYLSAIDTYSSTVNDVRVRQWATSGMSSSGLNDSYATYCYGPATTTYGGHVTFIYCMANDSFAQTDPAVTQANLTTAGNRCKAFGDVIFLIDHESNLGTANVAAYKAAVRAAAAAVGAVCLDIPARLGVAAVAAALGRIASDNIHLVLRAQANLANWLASIFAYLSNL